MCARPEARNACRRPGSSAESSPSTKPRSSASRSPSGAALERSLQVRAQPVGDATDPAPPADDPYLVRAQHDVDPAPRQPGTLVEAGLGPTRRDQPRAHDLQHGAARGRAPAADLEQRPLAHDEAGKATHLDRHAHGERRRARRPDDRDARTTGLADAQRQRTPVERVGSQRAPRQTEQREGHRARDQASSTRRRRERSDERRRRRRPVAAARAAETQLPAASPAHTETTSAVGHRSQDALDHGVTRSRSCSIRAGPIPGTSSRSSTDANGPCA